MRLLPFMTMLAFLSLIMLALFVNVKVSAETPNDNPPSNPPVPEDICWYAKSVQYQTEYFNIKCPNE